MKFKFSEIQKSFCIFFILLGVSLTIVPTEAYEYSPQEEIDVDGDRTLDGNGTYVTSHYQLRLQSYNSITNTAKYKIGSWWEFEGGSRLYSDDLYINGKHVGTFSGNNGWHEKGTIERGQWLESDAFHSGRNTFETTNVEGVGGESFGTITIDTFATAPEVLSTNGTWYEGDVAMGLRTWQSLYTDGATGSVEGNKVQTATGFMYKDVDEQVTPVNAYDSSTIGSNSYIAEIKNANTGQLLPLYNIDALNNVGTYWVKSCTKDKGGLEGCGSRYISVKDRKYSIGYAGNGATSGSTSSQTCTVLYDCTLNNNGFRREFSVSFNGNGGTASQASSVAKASFLGWMDHNNFNYKGAVYPYWTFNAPFYANYHPDVRNQNGYSKSALIDHWLATSVNNDWETRQSSEFFNITHYMKHGGSDLQVAFGNHRPSYVNHYTYNGYYEGRSGSVPINGQFDTYPNRATVKNLSMGNGDNLTLTAKWKDGSVILPNATRPGYKLIGWTFGNGTMIGKPGESYTPSSNTTIYAKWDKAPTISAGNQTFYEGQYSDEEWKNTQRWVGVSANDQEDGNISKNIQIESDNVNVNVPGTYNVTYKVTDSVGQSAKITVTITVLFNNPPVIEAEDRWFYVSEDITNEILMERVKAMDQEDGDISNKANILSSEVMEHVAGEYKVVYQVIDSFGKIARTSAIIHIVEDVPYDETDDMYLRFINKNHLPTLREQSFWSQAENLDVLNATLGREEGDEKAHIKLSKEDVEAIQAFNDSHDFSQESNALFYEQFRHLWEEGGE